jgi:hypothetical protein
MLVVIRIVEQLISYSSELLRKIFTDIRQNIAKDHVTKVPNNGEKTKLAYNFSFYGKKTFTWQFPSPSICSSDKPYVTNL